MTKERLEELKTAINGHHGLKGWVTIAAHELISEVQSLRIQLEAADAGARILDSQLRIATGALKSAVGYEPFSNSLEPRRCSEALAKIAAIRNSTSPGGNHQEGESK